MPSKMDVKSRCVSVENLGFCENVSLVKNISQNKKGCFNGEKNVIMPRGHKIPSSTIYHASYSFIQGGKKKLPHLSEV